MTETPQVASRTTLRGTRRIAVIAIIASLGITAVVGIVSLLSGSFGETQGKILLTTLVLAAFSITALCHLAVVGRALQVVGFAGIAASGLAFIVAVVLIWSQWDFSSSVMQFEFKALGTLSVIALSLAHANLLLLLAERRRSLIRGGLMATLVLIALVGIGIILPILSDETIPGDNGDWYWRLFGVVAILDVLGTIVLPVTAIFLRDEPRALLRLELSLELDARLSHLAAAQQSTREAVAEAALERGLGA